MGASTEVKGQSEWMMNVIDKWGQRERRCYSLGEWVVEVTDKWGAKRKRVLFTRREEEKTQWVVE